MDQFIVAVEFFLIAGVGVSAGVLMKTVFHWGCFAFCVASTATTIAGLPHHVHYPVLGMLAGTALFFASRSQWVSNVFWQDKPAEMTRVIPSLAYLALLWDILILPFLFFSFY